MKGLYLVLFFLTIVRAVNVDLQVDWREFISRSDPLWSFDTSKPETVPTMWFDSPFHGNGNLGMLILGRKDSTKWN